MPAMSLAVRDDKAARLIVSSLLSIFFVNFCHSLSFFLFFVVLLLI
jgi:hypothetical protein